MTDSAPPIAPPRARRVTGRHKLLAAALTILLIAAVYTVLAPPGGTISVTAHFTRTTGLYVGDDVRLMGVRTGAVTGIDPQGDTVAVRMRIDADNKVAAHARALIVSHSLVSARFVQLTPPIDHGPALADGAVIPIGRTAVPIEWNEMTEQVGALADDLGPATDGSGTDDGGPLGHVIDAADDALDDTGPSLRSTLDSLRDAMTTLSRGSDDLTGTVRNLQVFATALRDSQGRIEDFHSTMATASDVLADNDDDLHETLDTLDTTLDSVTGFVRDNRDAAATAAEQLADTTGTLAAQRDDLAQILHVAPTALANLENMYQPAHNAVVSALALSNFAHPRNFLCSAIAAAENVGARQGAQLCVDYFGPILQALTMDYPPIASNPTRGVTARPGHLVDSPPGYGGDGAPDGTGPDGEGH